MLVQCWFTIVSPGKLVPVRRIFPRKSYELRAIYGSKGTSTSSTRVSVLSREYFVLHAYEYYNSTMPKPLLSASSFGQKYICGI
jgi:hypothetical protein